MVKIIILIIVRQHGTEGLGKAITYDMPIFSSDFFGEPHKFTKKELH